MDYRDYKVSNVEERVIQQHFQMYLAHNDIDPDDMGWSSLEFQSEYEMFKTAWVMARAFTD